MPGKALASHRLLKLLVPVAWVMQFALACASNPAPRYVEAAPRYKLAVKDDFGVLLLHAGLPPEELPTGNELSAEQVRQLQLQLDLNRPKPSQEAPWLVANFLLHQATEQKPRAVSIAELNSRLQTFESLYVLRRDGYFARALSGKAEQCVGPVEVRNGGLHAGDFEVDHFYQRDAKQQWEPATMKVPIAALAP
jgi:hypothetical protein